VKIGKNKVFGRNIEDDLEDSQQSSFTSKRLLVGDFTKAENAMKVISKNISNTNWLYCPVFGVVVHPLEMTDGGLSEVEERVMQELVAGSFPKVRKVIVWVGEVLSDKEVLSQFNGAS